MFHKTFVRKKWMLGAASSRAGMQLSSPMVATVRGLAKRDLPVQTTNSALTDGTGTAFVPDCEHFPRCLCDLTLILMSLLRFPDGEERVEEDRGRGTPIARASQLRFKGLRPRPRMAGQVNCAEHLRISTLHNRARNPTEEDQVMWHKQRKSCKKKLHKKEAVLHALRQKIADRKVLIEYENNN